VRNFSRKVAMCLAHIMGDYKLVDVANHFGLSHYGGVEPVIHWVKRDMQLVIKIDLRLNNIVNRFDPMIRRHDHDCALGSVG
jgi:hypothetical protein